MSLGVFTQERALFHRYLLEKEILSYSRVSKTNEKKFDVQWVASNADTGNNFSIGISNSLIEKISSKSSTEIAYRDTKKKGQTLGNEFEEAVARFTKRTFAQLGHLRPGEWTIDKITGREESIIGRYEQYSHLAELGEIIRKNTELRTFLGEGYTVAPDIIVARSPESDLRINENTNVVDNRSSLRSMLRLSNHANPDVPLELLHASISCKFTMRSDRAQNTRTEALNLIRNRKGRSPHIVAVTAEAAPSRIASLALGTGDLDCVYHFALYELEETLDELGKDDAQDLLKTMIEGKRLKDISDLPLDLAI